VLKQAYDKYVVLSEKEIEKIWKQAINCTKQFQENWDKTKKVQYLDLFEDYID